ncbi:MAG: ATP-dependent zinc metalloprotease FtsH [Chloroflexi bacterium]|nr:ATP-dependent zinc metalloprotease FtsH [Chloroflexota bacterium]
MKRLPALFARPIARVICVVALLGLVLALILVSNLSRLTAHNAAQPIAASEAVSLIKSGQARSLDVMANRAYLQTADGAEYIFVRDHEASLPQMLSALGVTADEFDKLTYTVEDQTPFQWGEVLPAMLMMGLVAGVLLMSMRRSPNGPGLGFGRSRARRFVGQAQSVRFEDVAGAAEAKEELFELVDFLKSPQRFAAMGARIPKGVLLVGPPGTGKTLISRAVAGEAGVPFFNISGSEFVEMFVGVGASRVRDLFQQAKRQAPAIVFIDEIDAVGRKRSSGQAGGAHDEREQTLNQILVEMDGFEGSSHVIVVAATNRPDVLDPALLRPGRFDRQVTLANPDVKERTAILEVHARGKPLEGRVQLETLARSTPGFSGADLANLVNEAAILAVRRERKAIMMSDLHEAIDRVIGGPQKKARVISEAELRRTAYHEGGHAVVGRFSENHDPVHKVTIVARGRMGGYTRFLPEEDRQYMTRAGFEAMIASALGGWVAERLVFGEVSTGASNDIEKATNIAHGMVTTYGMSDSLGPLALGQRETGGYLGAQGEARPYSERVAEAIDAEVHRLIDAGMRQAEDILTRHSAVLDALAARLLEDETVEGDDLEQVFVGEAQADGVVLPLPRSRQRPSGANLMPLPRFAAGLASTVTDGTESTESV